MKRLGDQTLYEVLEVREDAPSAEIQAAWERARDLFGPGSLAAYTLMTPDEAELLAKRIEEARATLLDPGARARYDEALRHPVDRVAAKGAAAANGPAAALGTLPPVIPALRPPPPAPAREPASPPSPPAAGPDEGPAVEPSVARPAIPGAVPGEEAPGAAPASPAEPPPPRPILLQREVAPAPPPLPEAAPPPEAPRPPVPALPDGAWTGDALRQVREARGLSVQQIAERTRVTRHHIENIEDERFGALPAPVYLRGILVSIARELRLDGQKVARAYLERAAAALGKPR